MRKILRPILPEIVEAAVRALLRDALQISTSFQHMDASRRTVAEAESESPLSGYKGDKGGFKGYKGHLPAAQLTAWVSLCCC